MLEGKVIEFIEVFQMLHNVFRIDKDVININNQPGIFSKDILHSLMKFTQCILKVERHHLPLVVTMWNNEGYCVPIFENNLNLIKTRLEIKLA